MNTQENLREAFAGESQANRKYLAFSKKAEQEGKSNLAKLFRAAAEGETVHALNHLRTLGGIKDSTENLKVAIEGETYEVEQMYPKFIDEAKGDGDKAAEITFSGANQVEKTHLDLYKDALEKTQEGLDINEEKYFVCEVCGHLELKEAPEKCPVCNSPKEKFFEVM